MKWSIRLCASAIVLATGCSLVTSLDNWTFEDEYARDAGMPDAATDTMMRPLQTEMRLLQTPMRVLRMPAAILFAMACV